MAGSPKVRLVTLVVTRRRPLLVLVALALGTAVAGAAVWWVVDGERLQAVSDLDTLRAERDALREERDALEARSRELTRRVATLERNRQVEADAYERVDRELGVLEQEILTLREELAFYRGIVSDDSPAGNVRIQRFVLEPEGLGREYRFRLVLTRGIRSDNVASGAVTLAVDGDRDGQRLRLGLADLAPAPAAPLQYRFKHFQRIEGRLRLPDRFVPRRVVVQVQADRDGSRPLNESFKWPSVNS